VPGIAVAVVTPQPRDGISTEEQVSSRHFETYLSALDRYVITPKRLERPLPGFERCVFPDRFFGCRAA
jgi:hypothetical protein